MSKAESGGGEGVEILVNEPYEDELRKGQFTHKVSNVESRWFTTQPCMLLVGQHQTHPPSPLTKPHAMD